jgi:hypothetical protein
VLALVRHLDVAFADPWDGCSVIYQTFGAVDLDVVVIVVIASGGGRFGLRMGESKKESVGFAKVIG